MPATMLLASLILSQAPIVAATHQKPESAQVDAAYEELTSGETEAAIESLEQNSELDSQDPARLINLGTAYARQGDYTSAEKAFQAAIMSDDRYELELSDGTWMDSRRAARIALLRLQRGETISRR